MYMTVHALLQYILAGKLESYVYICKLHVYLGYTSVGAIIMFSEHLYYRKKAVNVNNIIFFSQTGHRWVGK